LKSILSSQSGRMSVPQSRALVSDILHFHQAIPTCAQDRLIPLAELDELRRGLRNRISWPAIFLKAFSAVAVQHPKLRQTWRSWPWPHIFQHESAWGTVAVSRRFREDDWLFWGQFESPESTELEEIQEKLDRFQNGHVEEVFRKQLLLSSLPRLARRLIWWWQLNLAGEKRVKRTGTFSLSSVAGRGAEIQHPPGFVTSVLTFGPINSEGKSRVTIAYDHRLMDGAFVADRLEELETELHSSTPPFGQSCWLCSDPILEKRRRPTLR
jgi:hypothetical protein